MKLSRESGILLHPTSLPGLFGIGSLGREAEQFIEILAEAEQGLWQILPLGPVGYGYSPYQSTSAFAGNPLLVDIKTLSDNGWLDWNSIQPAAEGTTSKINFSDVVSSKSGLLREAFNNFRMAASNESPEYFSFVADQAYWLDDYAVFSALKNKFDGKPWYDWPEDYRIKQNFKPDFRETVTEDIEYFYFEQFTFFSQWKRIHQYAQSRKIRIIGDMPIFVAHDSADVWANPELFYLDEEMNPIAVAGVPPDYFSPTGQRWGNPLYRWDTLKATGYNWWIERFRALLSMVDILRVDHFRGFEQYWEVPAGDKTAENGKWVVGPGADFFQKLIEAFKDMPIVAEDLGVITPEVEELRDRFGFPGMKILQFAFGSDARNPYLPHNYVESCVVYTGTHDNDTTCGWYEKMADESGSDRESDRTITKHIRDYLGYNPKEINRALIRLAMQSTARWCVIPAQDILGLNSSARMNTPGLASGNWMWKLDTMDTLKKEMKYMLELTRLYRRTLSNREQGEN